MKQKDSVKKQYEHELKMLTQENEELREQLKSLKEQFEKAITVSSTLEESYKKNSELSRALKDSEAQCDDLRKRLEISMKNCSELESKTAVQPRQKSLQPKVEALKAEISQLNIQIKSLTNKKIELEEKTKQQENVEKSLQNDLSQIFTSASTFFSTPINSVQSLLQCFIPKPVINESSVSSAKEEPDYSGAFQKLQFKVEKWKMKYEQEHELCIQMQANRPPPQTPTKKEDLRLQISDLNHANQTLASRVQQLSAELEKSRQVNAQQQAKIRIFELQQNNKTEEENIQYQQRIASLTSENNTLKIEKEKLKSKLSCQINHVKQTTKESTDYQIKMQTQEAEIQSNALQIQKLKTDNTELAKRLKCSEKQRSKLSRQVAKLEMDIKESEKDVKASEQKYIDAQTDLKKNEIIIDSMKKEMDAFKEDYQNKALKIATLSKQVEIYEQQQKQQKQVIEQKPQKQVCEQRFQYDLIPLAAWNCPDFPRELSDKINSIVHNQMIPISGKLKSILDEIAQYYNVKISKIEGASKSQINELTEMKKKVNNFGEFLRRRYPDVHIDFNNIIDDDHSREILNEYITNQTTTLAQLTAEKSKTDNQMIELYVALDADTFNDAKSNAEVMRTILAKQKDTISVMKKEVSSLKRAYNENEQENQNVLRQLEEEVDSMKEAAEKLENTITEKNASIDALNKEKETISNNYLATKQDLESRNKELQELTQKYQSIYKAYNQSQTIIKQSKIEIAKLVSCIQNMKTKHKEALKEKTADFESRNQQIMEQMKNLTEESTKTINELRSTVANNEEQISSLSTENSALQIKLKQQETKFNATLTENARNQKANEAQASAKIRSIETDYKNKINDIEQSKLNMVNSISSILSPLLATGERLDIYSLESVLQNIRARFELVMMRDNRIRTLLRIGPTQSIEDAIAEKIRK